MKRKFYWAYLSHLASSRMVLLETRRLSNAMVRVRLTLAPLRKHKRPILDRESINEAIIAKP